LFIEVGFYDAKLLGRVVDAAKCEPSFFCRPHHLAAMSPHSPAGVAQIGYAMHYSRSHHAVIRVYDAAGNVIETHKHEGDFREW
jgi:hypothetical protein